MNTNKLRDLREDKDLTQTDIAEILNVNQTTYSRYDVATSTTYRLMF